MNETNNELRTWLAEGAQQRLRRGERLSAVLDWMKTSAPEGTSPIFHISVLAGISQLPLAQIVWVGRWAGFSEDVPGLSDREFDDEYHASFVESLRDGREP